MNLNRLKRVTKIYNNFLKNNKHKSKYNFCLKAEGFGNETFTGS